MNSITISIVGLGWLGLPLYYHLKELGFSVAGSKTTHSGLHELLDAGVNAFHLNLLLDASLSYSVLNSEVLIINIPPSGLIVNGNQKYASVIKDFISSFSKETRVLFVSSTSVFGSVLGEVNDNSFFTPETVSAKALVEIENWLNNELPKSNVIRFAGLYGPNRHPGRFFSGKSGIANGDSPVNFIHQKDAIKIIAKVIKEGYTGLRINACATEHPPKKEYYKVASINGGFQQPDFIEGGSDSKVIKCNWLQDQSFVFEKGIWSF